MPIKGARQSRVILQAKRLPSIEAHHCFAFKPEYKFLSVSLVQGEGQGESQSEALCQRFLLMVFFHLAVFLPLLVTFLDYLAMFFPYKVICEPIVLVLFDPVAMMMNPPILRIPMLMIRIPVSAHLAGAHRVDSAPNPDGFAPIPGGTAAKTPAGSGATNWNRASCPDDPTCLRDAHQRPRPDVPAATWPCWDALPGRLGCSTVPDAPPAPGGSTGIDPQCASAPGCCANTGRTEAINNIVRTIVTIRFISSISI